MRVDGSKITHLRQSKAMTQEKLAQMSNVHIRTIQRAESGGDLSLESVSQIAAALAVPQLEIMRLYGDEKPDDSTETSGPATSDEADPAVTVLRIERSADQLLKLLDRCFTCKIEVGFAVDEETSKAVLTFSEQIEPHLPNPTPAKHRMFDEYDVHPEVQRIRKQMAATAQVSECLRQLKANGLTLYAGCYAAYGRMPTWDQEENCWCVRGHQEPEPILVAVLRLGRPSSERQTARIAPLTDWWA